MHTASNNHSLRARFIYVEDGPPLENGVIEIVAGRITDLHFRPDSKTVDLGNVAIIPGLINAHTHLEFSDLSEPVSPAQPFTDWIRAVVSNRRNRTEPIQSVTARGLAESVQHGSTTLGDISTHDTRGKYSDFPESPRTVVFRELLGFSPEQIEPQLQIARDHLDVTSVKNGRVTHGISPHAPYSVHPDLFRRLVVLAMERRVHIAMHLAETQAEIEFLKEGTGPFVEMLQEFEVWNSDAISKGTRPISYLEELSGTERALVIHGNYFDQEEIQFLADNPHLTLIYCPRTHDYFGHPPHPWLELASLVGNVAIGTDSRASNPDLSLWNELLFLRKRHPGIDDSQLLKIATMNAAIALDCDAETGSLTIGKTGDLAVVSLSSFSRNNQPDLFSSDHQISQVMISGQWISGNEDNSFA
jgi:aminodeoxyfutalosine deaminase